MTRLEPIHRGADHTLNIRFADNKGKPVDVTGWRLTFTLKMAAGLTENALQVEAEGIGDNARLGLVVIQLGDELTDDLLPIDHFCELKLNRSGDVKILAQGKVKVLGDDSSGTPSDDVQAVQVTLYDTQTLTFDTKVVAITADDQAFLATYKDDVQRLRDDTSLKHGEVQVAAIVVGQAKELIVAAEAEVSADRTAVDQYYREISDIAEEVREIKPQAEFVATAKADVENHRIEVIKTYNLSKNLKDSANLIYGRINGEVSKNQQLHSDILAAQTNYQATVDAVDLDVQAAVDAKTVSEGIQQDVTQKQADITAKSTTINTQYGEILVARDHINVVKADIDTLNTNVSAAIASQGATEVARVEAAGQSAVDSAAKAFTSEQAAEQWAIATDEDRVATDADRIAVAADKAIVAADKAIVTTDKAQVRADRDLTNGYKNAAAGSATLASNHAEAAHEHDVRSTNSAARAYESEQSTASLLSDTLEAKTAAATSEANALASENKSKTSENNALASEQKAEKWAEEVEDTEVETGKYSAKHWAAKAEYDEQQIGQSKTDAAASAAKAEQWADAAEDTEVETGKYSARHWAEKSAQIKHDVENANTVITSDIELARRWGSEDEDVLVSDTYGHSEYSAKHYSIKSQKWADTAKNTEVLSGRFSALHWSEIAKDYADSVQNLGQNAQAEVAKARQWATEAVDTEVETGEFSALHHATKANESAASLSTALTTAEGYRDKAQKWAEEAEDTEVETGLFSAHHWANKSQSFATASELAKKSAETAVLNANTFLPAQGDTEGQVLISDGAVATWQDAPAGFLVGQLVYFALNDVPPGFFALDGSTIPNGETDYPDLWAIASTSSSNFFVRRSGTNLVLQNMDDFLRGKGSSSKAIGAYESDAIRNITGYFGGGFYVEHSRVSTSGALYVSSTTQLNKYTNAGWSSFGPRISFSASRSVTTADQVRPRSYTALACIYHGVFE